MSRDRLTGLLLLVALSGCGGGSSDGAGGSTGRSTNVAAGQFVGTFDLSLTDGNNGRVLLVGAGTVQATVAESGTATVVFDDRPPMTGNLNGDNSLTLSLEVAPFVGHVGCKTGTVTLVLNFSDDAGTASGPINSRDAVCQGVPVALTGIVSLSRSS